MLHTHHPLAHIILIGESIGGIIATEIIGKQYFAPVDRVILISPMIYSPEEALSNFFDNLHFNRLTDQKINVRLIDKNSLDLMSGKFEGIYSADFFDHFFSSSDKNIDLLKRLGQSCEHPVQIIYGNLDLRIGIKKLSIISNLKCVKTNVIFRMDHIPSPMYFEQISHLIQLFSNTDH